MTDSESDLERGRSRLASVNGLSQMAAIRKLGKLVDSLDRSPITKRTIGKARQGRVNALERLGRAEPATS